MEIFLFVALIFLYILTALTVPERIVKRVWIAAYIAAFLMTAISVMLIDEGRQSVLMEENELNWYYFLYLFGSMSAILGVINLWIYRRPLARIFSQKDESENDGNDSKAVK
jgi:Na+/H+ antiporter NhaD/arsenite permease-like protein